MKLSTPDHPAFGNGGDPDSVPHPFPDLDPETQEVVVIQAPKDDNGIYPAWLEDIKAEARANGKGLAATILEDYEVDEDSAPAWDSRPVTVGLDADDPRPGDVVKTIKRPVEKRPEFVHKLLKKRGA